MPRRNIKEVLKKHTAELMEMPGVTGVAEGESQSKPCIRVFVLDGKSEFLRRIPSTLEGYPVQVEDSGEFRALGTQ
jgi:hypothetical protein